MIYEPREDSFLLKKYVSKYASGKVLDLGCGCGILSLEALKKTNNVLAVDINKEAVKYCKGLKINAKYSNLFSNIKEKFDLIIFNPPYLPYDKNEDKETRKMVCGGKKGYEIIEKFLKQAKKYLNKKGKILLLFSSLTGDVNKILKKYNYKFKLLEEKKLFFEKLYIYLVETKYL
jgi:release factor glutamine methyltransferase